MKDFLRRIVASKSIVALSFAVLLLLATAFFAYSYFSRSAEIKALTEKNKQLEEAVENSRDSYSKIANDNQSLLQMIVEERSKNETYSSQLDELSLTADRLERLSKLDPQLLQKYSKVYFLNENYAPLELTNIDTKYLSNKSKPLQIHDRVWMFLKNMLDAAAADGVTLQAASSYRSFGTQAALKSSYKVTYGSGANSFSADQGYSEHQLGTAVDLTTPALNGGLTGFEKTNAYAWLTNNAYKYGFVLSYPQNNSYYIFEPWHWRFVGLELAQKLHDENKRFYDLDQRDINSYLMNIFSATPSSTSNP